MVKQSSLNRKEMRKKETWHISNEERAQQAKIQINAIGLPPALEFSKSCLRIEAKIVILTDAVLNVYEGNN